MAGCGLEGGADILEPDTTGNSALHVAAACSWSSTTVQAIVDYAIHHEMLVTQEKADVNHLIEVSPLLTSMKLFPPHPTVRAVWLGRRVPPPSRMLTLSISHLSANSELPHPTLAHHLAVVVFQANQDATIPTNPKERANPKSAINVRMKAITAAVARRAHEFGPHVGNHTMVATRRGGAAPSCSVLHLRNHVRLRFRSRSLLTP